MKTEEVVYADCAASAPVLPSAWNAYLDASAVFGNPSSVHSRGREAKKLLENARKTIADCIGCEPEEIIFTSGATESCNILVKSIVDNTVNIKYAALLHSSCVNSLEEHLYVKLMHPSVKSSDYEKGYVGTLVCNETGTVSTVSRTRRADTLRGYDGTAAVGHIDIRLDGIDYLAAGAHKFGGLPGIGFLYVRKGCPVSPVILGGGQENGMRGGTESFALASAMAAALRYRTRHMTANSRLWTVQQSWERQWLNSIPGAEIVGYGTAKRVPGITSLMIPGISAAELVSMMDALGVCISAGSACNSRNQEPSRVLLAHGLTPEQALSTVRISIDPEHYGNYRKVDEALKAAIEKLKNR